MGEYSENARRLALELREKALANMNPSKFKVGDVIVPTAGGVASYTGHGHIMEVNPTVGSGLPSYRVHWSDVGEWTQTARFIDSNYELAGIDHNG